MTVTTSADVEAVSVDGTIVESYRVRNGKRVWTAKVEAKEAGEQTISVVAYNADGNASNETTTTVTVVSGTSWIGTTIGKIISNLFSWLVW